MGVRCGLASVTAGVFGTIGGKRSSRLIIAWLMIVVFITGLVGWYLGIVCGSLVRCAGRGLMSWKHGIMIFSVKIAGLLRCGSAIAANGIMFLMGLSIVVIVGLVRLEDKIMTTVNHWGKWVDSEVATMGVLSVNDVAFEWLDDFHCLTCENGLDDIEAERNISLEDGFLIAWDGEIIEGEDEINDYFDNEVELVECDSDHLRLIGDWCQDDKGEWMADRAGDFAAIEQGSTVQVIWSRYVVRGPLCSPCFPGQADINADSSLDYEGGFLAYTLPDYLLRKGE